jgi:hypothetical protein
MDAIINKQTGYGTVEFNLKNKKKYTHTTTLSDGTVLEITSDEPTFHTFAVESFRHQGEAMLFRRRMKERYLAKKAKQNGE